MQDRYHMSKEDNVFLAHRNIVDTLWRSARLEGLGLTFPQTATIYNEGMLDRIPFEAVIILNNLKRSWQLILNSLDLPLDLELLCKLHKEVGDKLVRNPGNLRTTEVSIGGTNWHPTLPEEALLTKALLKAEQGVHPTESAINLMLYLMRAQPFWDGNKRTAILAANHILIRNGCGVLSVPVDLQDEFLTLLIKFYETGDSEKIFEFVYNSCIEGIDFDSAETTEFKDEQ